MIRVYLKCFRQHFYHFSIFTLRGNRGKSYRLPCFNFHFSCLRYSSTLIHFSAEACFMDDIYLKFFRYSFMVLLNYLNQFPYFLFLSYFPVLSYFLSLSTTSCLQMFFKIGILKNFAIFTGKYLCGSVCNFIGKRFQRRCFPVNIAKFLRTAFFWEHLRWLPLFSLLDVLLLIQYQR